MAKSSAAGSGGDWSAGIIAIVATVFLAGAAPVALYYALYMPRVAERKAEEVKLSDQKKIESELMLRAAAVRKIEEDGETMAGRLAALEVEFAPADAVPETIRRLSEVAKSHNLVLRKERQRMLGAQVVYADGPPLVFKNGLRATRVMISGQAKFHDLARFVAELENQQPIVSSSGSRPADAPAAARHALVLVESLEMQGDQNGGYSHNFEMIVYVIERRDIEQVGK